MTTKLCSECQNPMIPQQNVVGGTSYWCPVAHKIPTLEEIEKDKQFMRKFDEAADRIKTILTTGRN